MSSYNVSEKYSAIRAEYLGTCNGVYMFRFGKEGRLSLFSSATVNLL